MNPQLIEALVANAKEVVRPFPTAELDECFSMLSKCCLDEKYCRKLICKNSDKVVAAKLRKMSFSQLQDICRLAMRTINEVKKERKSEAVNEQG